MAAADTSLSPSKEQEQSHPPESRRGSALLVFLGCAVLSAAATVPFFFMGEPEAGQAERSLGMPVTHDMFLHYDQMRSFYRGLAAGKIFPRWEEETNRGFGAPTTNYYPPGIYYLTAACYVVARNWEKALLAAHLAMMIASGLAMYAYARQSMNRWAAATAMLAYIVLPYHLLDQYQRGAIAELLGFVWMPLILLFGEKLVGVRSIAGRSRANGDGAEDSSGGARVAVYPAVFAIAGLAVSYAAFVWSHPPTAYQFTLALGLYLLLLILIHRNWKAPVPVALGIGLGLALSAAYLYPAAAEQDLIHHEYVENTWPYHNTYVFVHNLYNFEGNRGFFHLIDGLWTFGLAVILFGTVALILLMRRSGANGSGLRTRVLAWGVVGLAASFMMTKASYPLGRLIPKIDIGVFTWRMLSITTLITALLAGASIQIASDAYRRRQRKAIAVCFSFTGIIVAGGVLLSLFAVMKPTYHAPAFVPEEEHLNWATLPKTATEEPGDLPSDMPPAELSEENGEVEIQRWDPEHREISVNALEDDALEVRTFNFPGWTAALDGKAAPIQTGEEFSDIEIDVPAGAHQVTLDFLPTPARQMGIRVTKAAFGLTLGVMLFGCLIRIARTKRRVGPIEQSRATA